MADLLYRKVSIKNHLHYAGGFFITKLTWDINPKTYHPNGGVRGGTLRLLPVDSKAEATRSRLLSS